MLCFLFESFIYPILLYCSEGGRACISPKRLNADIFKKNMFKDAYLREKLHVRFCKQTLCFQSKLPNHAYRAELKYELQLTGCQLKLEDRKEYRDQRDSVIFVKITKLVTSFIIS